VRIAPALGLVGLAVTLVLILGNLDGLAGSNALGWGIVGLLVVAFALGVFVGTRTVQPAKSPRA
jgi:flagellar motor component MotA